MTFCVIVPLSDKLNTTSVHNNNTQFGIFTDRLHPPYCVMFYSNWICILLLVYNALPTKCSITVERVPYAKETPAPSENLLGNYSEAAVAGNGYPCALIGREVLQNGGTAVDAAVAALFCEGIIAPESMGLGGGFLMTIYIRETQEAFSLNAREMAPLAASQNMFKGNEELSQKGGLAVAIPGSLKGLWEAHQRFGSLQWKDLLQPTIELCSEGVPVGPHLAQSLIEKEYDIMESETLSEIFVNPNTGEIWRSGEKMFRPKLAEFLQRIAEEGADVFYTGDLAQVFTSDVQRLGGIITMDDMAAYRATWEDPVATALGDVTLYTAPLPGTGVVLSFLLSVLQEIVPAQDPVVTYQRIAEVMKYAYAKRTFLGDDDFADVQEVVGNLTSLDFIYEIINSINDTQTWNTPEHYGAYSGITEDHGTAHLCVLAPNGDAVSVTSTVNLYFGAKVRSRGTGLILNNEMDDFSSPNVTNAFGVTPSPANFIQPLKRPLSSMVPTIFVDVNGDVRLVVGAAGGTRITTVVAQIAINNLWLNQSIADSMNGPRIHHQLVPMKLSYEQGFPEEYVEALQKMGHVTSMDESYQSSTNAISRQDGRIYAMGDFRRNMTGVVDGF